MPARAALLTLSILTTVELLELHGPDGQTYYVAPGHISSLRQPTKSDIASHFAAHVHCVVVTTNAKFLAVVETCATIRDRLEAR